MGTVKDTEQLRVQRCDTWEWSTMKPATFFHAYNRSSMADVASTDPDIHLLKLKDYPPAANFASVLPRHLQVRQRVARLPGPAAAVHMALVVRNSCIVACESRRLAKWPCSHT